MQSKEYFQQYFTGKEDTNRGLWTLETAQDSNHKSSKLRVETLNDYSSLSPHLEKLKVNQKKTSYHTLTHNWVVIPAGNCPQLTVLD